MLTFEGRVTGRHVLFATLAFFGVIAAVNAGMIYLAVTTFSGLETQNAYVRGLSYNDVLRDAEAQKALGWQVSLDHEHREGRLELDARFLDKAGQPLDGLEVAVVLTRPTTQGHDLGLALAGLGEGRYRGELDVPLPGQWDLQTEARRDGRTLHTLEQRLWLK